MQVTGNGALHPGVLGPDSHSHRKGPDTHHVVCLVKDHNRPLQVDAVCPAALRGERMQDWRCTGQPQASGPQGQAGEGETEAQPSPAESHTAGDTRRGPLTLLQGGGWSGRQVLPTITELDVRGPSQ